MAFEIDQGVVKVTADVERSSLARAARSAGEEAGEQVEGGLRKGFGRSADRNKAESVGFVRKMFTPSPDAFAALKAPFAAALSTPIGAAAVVVAGVFAASFAAAAITAVLGLGLGTALLGLAGVALLGGREDRQKALEDLEKAEKKVADAEFRARKGSATSIRNLKEARLELAEAQRVVNEGKAFRELDDAVSNLGKTLQDVGKRAAMPLLKPFTEALNDTSELVRELGPEFRDIFSSLAPVVPLLTRAFGFFSGEVIRGVQDSMPGIVAAFEGLARVLPTVGKWIGDFFRTVFENEDVIDNTTEAVFKLVFGPLKLLGPLISGLTVLFGAFNNLMIMSREGWSLITEAMLSFFDGGTGAVGRFKEAWGPVSDAIQVVWDKLVAFAGEDNKELLTTRFTELIDAIKKAWAPIKNLIGVAWDEAWAFVKRVWNENVEPWINDTLIPWLREKLVALMEGAWEAAKKKATEKIGELIKAVVGVLFGLPIAIANTLAPIPGRVFSAISEAAARARSAASDLVSGTVRKIAELPGKVGAEVGKTKSRVTGAFSGAGSWLYSAGRAIMSGLLNGIQAAWNSVAGYLSSLAGKIKSLKGPLEKDRRLLIPEGAAIMDGLMEGLSSRFGGLAAMLSGLTDGIPQVVSGGSAPALAGGGFTPSPGPSRSSGSSGSMSPSFNVKVYVGDKEIRDVVRVEINEHDRSLDRQVSAGTGGFRL
jgi:phage-related protein